MKQEIIDRLQLIPTDKNIGSSFMYNIVIYKIELKENCNFYIYECDEDGKPSERNIITVFATSGNFRFKMSVTQEFLELCEVELIKTCILSEFNHHYERVCINS